jgi:hypothetical protein
MPFSVDVNFNEGAILFERFNFRESTARRYAAIINSYMDNMPENVRVFSMLVPTRLEFMPERYSSLQSSQRDAIDFINDLLHENIIRVAAYERLAAHADEYIYFRTDHHWTALGAYYAHISFADAAGFTPIRIHNYVEHSLSGFIGSLGRGTQNRTIRDNPDTLYYYVLDNGTTFTRRFFVIPQNMANLTYRVFMGGDHAILDFTSTNENGRTLVIVKESYANALIPWLAPYYERIIVIDSRHYTGSVMRRLRNLDNADLLFVNYMPATAMSDFIETISRVR